MSVLLQSRNLLRLLVLVAFATLLIFSVTGCGSDQDPADTSSSTLTPTSVAAADTIPVTDGGSSTSTSSPVNSASVTSTSSTTTTTAPTTTTAKPTTTTAKATTTTAKPTTTTAKAPTAVTITGPSGTKELSMADLKAMSATSGYGGWKNQLENITAPTSYKGVSLRSLMELVGGGGSVTVIASDGYTQSISAGEAGGAVNMYDPATGEPISSISGSLRGILAYAKGGGAIGGGDGPLRIAFVSPDKDQVTDSILWVKQVIRLEVN